jgi:hypothetical protein
MTFGTCHAKTPRRWYQRKVQTARRDGFRNTDMPAAHQMAISAFCLWTFFLTGRISCGFARIRLALLSGAAGTRRRPGSARRTIVLGHGSCAALGRTIPTVVVSAFQTARSARCRCSTRASDRAIMGPAAQGAAKVSAITPGLICVICPGSDDGHHRVFLMTTHHVPCLVSSPG